MLKRRGVLCVGWMLVACLGWANDIEPRRWGHMPLGGNFLTAGYAYTEGTIFIDPVLRIENVEMELDTWLAKYVHSFRLFGKSSRFDFTQGYQEGRWDGTVDGAPRSVQRNGPSDTYLRFAMNLVGAPPLKGKEFADYRQRTTRETIVGAGLVVQLPTGDYQEDKLINLGSNRFTVRPQLGVTRTVGKWTGELTGEVYFYSTNDEFFNGNTLEQSPLFTGQTHLIYSFRPGLWVSGSAGYAAGGTSTVNGKTKDDRRNAIAWAVSLGVPLARHWNAKASFLSSRAENLIGQDTDTLTFGLAYSW